MPSALSDYLDAIDGVHCDGAHCEAVNGETVYRLTAALRDIEAEAIWYADTTEHSPAVASAAKAFLTILARITDTGSADA